MRKIDLWKEEEAKKYFSGDDIWIIIKCHQTKRSIMIHAKENGKIEREAQYFDSKQKTE